MIRTLRLVAPALVLACTLPIQAAAQQASGPLTGSQRALWARLLEMSDTRTLDTSAVDQALVSASEPLAAFAALSVGQLGPALAAARAPRLRGLLRDPRARVAANAAFALGLLRDSLALAELTSALSAEPIRAAEAAWALGQIGESARQSITTALGAPGRDAAVEVQLLLAAARLRPVPVRAVVPHLSAGDPDVVWAAAYAISRPRAAEGMRHLLGLLQTAPAQRFVPATGSRTGYYRLGATAAERIRAEVARAIALPAVGDDLADTAVSLLRALAADPHPHVRINALRTLATFGVRAREPLTAATRDEDANVRIAAVQSLGMASEVGDVDWEQLWSADTAFTHRRYVLEAALQQGVVLAHAAEWATDGDWRRRLVVTAAGASRPAAALLHSRLLGAAQDADARVRQAALTALVSDTTLITDTVRAVLRHALADSDDGVRAAALAALLRANVVDPILGAEALERARADSDGDARLAAVRYLSAAWLRDSSSFPAEVRLRLASSPPPGDPVARNAAAALPLLQHWADARIEPRDAGFYLTVVDDLVVPTLRGRPREAVIHTARGAIVLELFGADAPLTVHNFVTLARGGYYDGLVFHRIVPNFVVQDGDPRGDGSGGPGYSIRDELNPRRYERGVLGMALSGPDTGGSQYFVTHSPQPHLDGGYTVFGRVLNGFRALDALVQGDGIERVEIR